MLIRTTITENTRITKGTTTAPLARTIEVITIEMPIGMKVQPISRLMCSPMAIAGLPCGRNSPSRKWPASSIAITSTPVMAMLATPRCGRSGRSGPSGPRRYSAPPSR